jgi:hypothetical protein
MRRRTAGLLALAVTLLAPASAQALEEKCKKTATVESGDVLHHTTFEDSAPLSGDTIARRSGFYRAASTVKLDYADNAYTIEKGAIFKLVCYGKSVQSGMTLPALDLLKGDVKVKTADKKPGGVITTEALLDPRDDPTMTFEVSRTLSRNDADPTPTQIRNWFAGFITAPRGTSKASTDGKPIIGVTPYVGPKRGSCRYVHGATLKSTGTTRKGYFTGTASYTP